ncbi:type II secretion system F family protein [Undibacterium flavidum]|uniref:Type II secretion system F family protein n=1 Tax=Undibacterium flavidum TaxID=2762297 RepID=A0ABR6YAY5_9BURK|nr:type II secretion system F family protein [Undibacterium flavidum]MBC3873734.1 type II secretion system F family protein [Undibacterium flavidum]
MLYEVRTLSSDNLISEHRVDAVDEDDVRRKMAACGLHTTAISPAKPALLNTFNSRQGQGKQLSVVLFSQELLALLRAGLSIVECLEALIEKESNANNRSVISRLLDGLREGKRFSSVLGEQADLFPPLYVGIIRAAEGTSDLPRSLERYINYQQRIDAVRSKIISASIYPIILFIVGGTVSLFLIAYVVPRFAQVYKGAGRNLPWMSQLLLDWGQFAASHTSTMISTIAISLLIGTIVIRHLLNTGAITRGIQNLPGIGERIRTYELSRLYLTLGMLLEGGIAIVPAMHTVQGIVSNNIQRALLIATSEIQSGTPLSTAFERNHLTTSISLRMLRVGERSGEMGQMLTQSAEFYDGEISRWIDRFTRMFEPLLMAAIGLIVGTIVVLLYMPIFDLAGSLS